MGPAVRGGADVRGELRTFDGRDNRREVMILLQRLGTDRRRARFIEGLIRLSGNGFASAPARVAGNCDPVTAYHLMIAACNELGVSINEAARRLEAEVKRGAQ